MSKSREPPGPGTRGSPERRDFSNSRAAASACTAVQVVNQGSRTQDLLHATRQMTLKELETYFAERFHEGEVKEMKHEFDTMARASHERSVQALDSAGMCPGASFLAAGQLEDLVLRIEATSHRTVEPGAVQRALAVVIGCRGGTSRTETMRSFSLA